MLQVEMSASVRETAGKGPMRQLRMKGITPAVVYGRGEEAMKIQLDSKILMAQLLKYSRKNVVVTLRVEGAGDKKVLISEIQTDPVTDALVHVDFCEIDLEKERAFSVPVDYQGKAKGVDLGGVLTINHSELLLQGKPLDIPNECVVDISDMSIGDKVRCSEIAIPDSVVMLTKGKDIAVTIAKPGQKIEEDDEEEAVAAAPEA